MEIRNFKTFLTIIRLGNFTKASDHLGYAQSTVTSHIQQIEDYYGMPVFDRIGKKVYLTDFGKLLQKEVVRLLDNYKRIEHLGEYTDIPQGVIRVGAEESIAIYRLKKILTKFKAAYPKVEIVFINAPYKELEPRLFDGEADVIFIIDRLVDNKELITETLFEEEMVFVNSPDYMKKRQSKEFRKPRIIQTKKGGTYRYLFDQYLREKKIDFEIAMEAWSIELVKQSLILGIGVAFLPKVTVTNEIRAGLLLSDSVSLDSDVKIYSQMIYHRDKFINPSLKAFIDMVREELNNL